MKKYCRFSISSYVIMIVLILLGVLLSCNVVRNGNTNYIKNMTSGRTVYSYFKETDFTLRVPLTMDYYCSPSTRIGTKDYFGKRNVIYYASSSEESLELFVRLNRLDPVQMKLSKLSSEEILELYSDMNANESNDCYRTLELLDSGIYEKDGVDFVWNELIRRNEEGEFDELVVTYGALCNGRFAEITCVGYYGASEEEAFLKYQKKLVEENAVRFMDEMQFGDSLPPAPKGIGKIWNRIKTFSFGLWVFLIPLFFLAAKDVLVAKDYGEWQEDSLSLEHSKTILGLSSIFIVLHHLAQKCGSSAGVMGILEDMGVCFVGLFFFFSGYGLVVSYRAKGGRAYLKGFLKKRLPTVLIPTYLCIFIFVVADIIARKTVDLRTLLTLTGVWLINSQMWYIVEIVFLYILFWLAFRFIKKEWLAYGTILVVILVMMAGSLLLGHGDWWFQGEWWYNTTLLFFVGLLGGRFAGPVVAWIKHHYTPMLVTAGLSFVVLFVNCRYVLRNFGYWTETGTTFARMGYGDKCITLFVQVPMVVAFVLLVLLIGLKIRIGNPVLKFFGTISLELYLIHNLFLTHLDWIVGDGVFACFVLVASILSAALLHRLTERIFCKMYGRPVSKLENPFRGFGSRYVTPAVTVTKYYLHYARKHPKDAGKYIIRNVIVFLIALLTLAPIYLMLMNATQDRVVRLALLPGSHFWENLMGMEGYYRSIGGSIFHGMFNSCVITIPSALLSVYVSALCAFAFENYDFKGKQLLWSMIIGAMFMSAYATFVGLYNMVVKVHMLNNFLPLILAAIPSPMGVYFIRMYLQNVKLTEMMEAARVDGLKEWQIFNRIILPIIRPALALLLTFSFTAVWNNGYYQTSLLYDWKYKTLASYLEVIAGGFGGGDPSEYAAMLFASLPPLIIYIICSKSIVGGITLGGVKE